jgi:NAD-dependent SIR2 family protein deacetylase
MNVLEEIKQVIDVKVVIDEKALADKIFDLGVDKLMLKLTEIIPTEFDDALYASKKEELKALFQELITEGVDKLEEKAGMDLDGKAE